MFPVRSRVVPAPRIVPAGRPAGSGLGGIFSRVASERMTSIPVTGDGCFTSENKNTGYAIYNDPAWRKFAEERPTPYPAQKEFEAVFLYEPYLEDQAKIWLADRNGLIGRTKRFFDDWPKMSGARFWSKHGCIVASLASAKQKSDADKIKLEARMQAALQAIGQPMPFQGFIIVPRAKAEGRIVFDIARPTINDIVEKGFDTKDDAQARINELIAKEAGKQAEQAATQQQTNIQPGGTTTAPVDDAAAKKKKTALIVGGGAAAALLAMVAAR